MRLYHSYGGPGQREHHEYDRHPVVHERLDQLLIEREGQPRRFGDARVGRLFTPGWGFQDLDVPSWYSVALETFLRDDL